MPEDSEGIMFWHTLTVCVYESRAKYAAGSQNCWVDKWSTVQCVEPKVLSAE